MIDVPAKTEGDNSNAVAGYYISSTGQVAPGRVASTSDIVAPPGSQPLPSQMPQQVPITPGAGQRAAAAGLSLSLSARRAPSATRSSPRPRGSPAPTWRFRP